MKLKMTDDSSTIITSTNFEIRWFTFYCEEDFQYYTEIVNAETGETILTYTGDDQQKRCRRDFEKLLTKGAREKFKETCMDEQEQAHWDGIAADNADPTKHGQERYSILAGKHSVVMCWDFYKQKCVAREELTTI